MDGIDPYRPDESVYECVECNGRFRTNDHLSSCEGCGGDVQNIAVPRE
ncbi:rubrerythrin-like domain-containing protein [Halorientalis pallida]|uniref:Rubrerythrin-like domain-containing protein n=1 Tax=Halorientalis pallida TaxID=2479928 RepID=A0A498KY33_9EURY|nr:rubrerythrin-like domain-containing protein [Halorientalis pallida]RXK49110.1 rubrerythrin-like domain-containing protein [Halorientalis pallida]